MPIVLPRFENTTINNILVTRFFQKPVMPSNLDRDSKSLTRGSFSFASESPANHPAASMGLSDVSGAAMNATSIVIGFASASAAPSADNEPFIIIHL